MKYDLRNQSDQKRFIKRCNALYQQSAFVELTNLEKRSLKQNNYLHLILSAFAMETGYTTECVKRNFFKLHCNRDIFMIQINGALGKQNILRSSKDLTTKEMTTAIDRFRTFASEQGFYLPEPNETEMLRSIEIQSSKMQNFL